MTADEKAAEFFTTPAWCVHRIMEAITLPEGNWIDPCVGEGAIAAAIADIMEPNIRWTTVDIRDTGHAQHVRNYLDERWVMRTYNVAFFNPPFSLAMRFAKRAKTHCKHVVMLQRLNWLQSPARAPWLRRNPPGVYVLPERPSFTGDGKYDSGGYAWYVWPPQHDTVQILASTPKEERRFKPTVDKRQTDMFLSTN